MNDVRVSMYLFLVESAHNCRSNKLLSQKKTLDRQPNEGLNKGDFVQGYYRLDAVTLSPVMLTGYTGPRISQDLLDQRDTGFCSLENCCHKRKR